MPGAAGDEQVLNAAPRVNSQMEISHSGPGDEVDNAEHHVHDRMDISHPGSGDEVDNAAPKGHQPFTS